MRFDRALRLAEIGLIALTAAGAAEARAACHGRDVFPILKAASPEVFARMETEAEATPFGKGRLFRLTGGAGNVSYVFGSVHLSDPRATRFSPTLRAVLDDSRVVAVEIEETSDDIVRSMKEEPAKMRSALAADKERRAERLLTRAELGKLEALVGKRRIAGLPVLDLKAGALALLLDLPACAVERGDAHADARLAALARRNGATIVGLESFVEQIEALDGLTRAEERALLAAVLRQSDQAEDSVETTLERYSEGNLGWLLAWMRSSDPLPLASGAPAPPAFFDRLITQRNLRMRDRALPLAARGGAFIIVGAAHLPGADGLLALFQQSGFEIERVE
jgi:hypothetical protein